LAGTIGVVESRLLRPQTSSLLQGKTRAVAGSRRAGVGHLDVARVSSGLGPDETIFYGRTICDIIWAISTTGLLSARMRHNVEEGQRMECEDKVHHVVCIIADLELPQALNRVDRSWIAALTVNPERLAVLRRARANRMGKGLSLSYASKEQVQRELDWAELILRRRRWATVNVTNKSIEECAAEIIDLQRRRTGEKT